MACSRTRVSRKHIWVGSGERSDAGECECKVVLDGGDGGPERKHVRAAIIIVHRMKDNEERGIDVRGLQMGSELG